MPSSRARPGSVRLGLVTAVLFALFVALTGIQLAAARREREEAEKRPVLADIPAPAPSRSSKDWPQWRGPERDGIAHASDLLDTWSAEGPPQLWQAATGEGFSSIASARGRVFTIVQAGAEEAIVCWDAATGQERWRYAYPCHYLNTYGNGPRSTPTIAGEYLFAIGATGLMHCLEAFAGKATLVWKKELQPEFDAPLPQWGFACSPLVEGDLVFIQPGGPSGNSIAALRRDSGAVVWKKLDHPASYSSPIAATIAGQRQVLFFTGTHLVSVTPEEGQVLWLHPWPTANFCNIATPIVAGDYVFISSGYDQGCELMRVSKGETGWQLESIYKNRRMRNHFATSVLVHGHLFGFDDSTLVCMDFSRGIIRWKERGFERGSLIVADDRLIIHGANGIVALADADPQAYRERGRMVPAGGQASAWSPPAVAEGRLYIRDEKKLTCYDVSREARE